PSASPDNGAVRAFIPNGSVENVTDYNFYWSIGSTAKPVASADHVGATYTGRPAGTYTVFAIHKTANCASDVKSVVVSNVTPTVDVDIVLDNPYDNCKTPNAKLRAEVNGDKTGSNVGQYTFTWYKGNDIFGELVGNSHIKAGLDPLPYTV